MRNSSVVALVTACTLCAFAGNAGAQTYTAYLTGTQEVPPAATNASGLGRVVINEGAGTMSFVVTFSGLTSNQTAAHIHAPAGVGTNAGVGITLGVVGGTSNTIQGGGAITPTQIAQIKSGLAYINVHSTNFPGGELRGQLALRRDVDFDGDGKTDPSILRFPAGTCPGPPKPITFYNLTSTLGFQGAQWGDACTDFPAPGDYDGDGKDDIAVYREGATTGAPSTFWILRSSDGAVQAVQWGVRGDQAVARDYDGDGKTDIAIYRRGAASTDPAYWWILQSASSTVRVTAWGTTGNGTSAFDSPVPQDYDGDGKADLAVYRFGLTPANSFIVLRSSDEAVQYRPFGNFSTDFVLNAGDFDGDGMADLTVARVGTGTAPMVWYILQSSNQQLRAAQFGISTDLPAAGDFDGDGKTDIAVYRSGGQSYFYALGSFNGAFIVQPWGIAGDFAVNTVFTR